MTSKGKFYLTVVISAVLITGGIITYNKVTKKPENKDDKGNGGSGGAKDNPSNKLSFDEIVYTRAADAIFKNLDGCETIWSEKDVLKIVMDTVKTQADWDKLVQVFGTRKVDNCGFLTGDTDYTLPALLKDQLDGASMNYKNVYAMLKAQLAEKGVIIN